MNSNVETGALNGPIIDLNILPYLPVSGDEEIDKSLEKELKIPDFVFWGRKGSYAESIYLIYSKTKGYIRDSGLTANIEKAFTYLSLKGIDIPKPAEVREYLLNYYDIVELLEHIGEVVKEGVTEKLSPETQIALEVYHDPEIEDNYLTLYIRQLDYDQNIMNVIDEICEKFEDELANKSGWLIVTTDFKKPG